MTSDDEGRFELCGEFDPGRGGAYSLALNADATRLFVVGESSWLDILDISAPSAIVSIAQTQIEGMPYGDDSKCGIAYDPNFERAVVGGGTGSKIYLIDVSGDQLNLQDAAYPPEIEFPGFAFENLVTTPPIFIKHGSAIAAAMKSGGCADDPSSGQTVCFGEGVYLLNIDPISHKLSVVEEGIGGFRTVFGQFYDSDRDLLWCGGQDGAEAIMEFSHGAMEQYRCWSCLSDNLPWRVFPDFVSHDGKWLIERVASRYPADHWFIRIRQIEATNGSYSLWNADMPTDGATPHLLGSPIDWNGDTEVPGSRISNKTLLPCILTHDEMYLITAEAGGSELLILDLTDKTAEPHVLFPKSVGEGEQIQSIKGYRNRFFVSLKSGRVLVYEWNFVQRPDAPPSLAAAASPLDQSIVLSWTPPPAGVPPAGYNVYRRTGSDPFQKVASVSETTWTDECTAEGTTYTYVVRCFAPRSVPVESDDSPEADATTPSAIPPKKVVGLSGESTLGGVALTWQPNPEEDVVGYIVYRKAGDAPFAKITSSPLTDPCLLDLDLEQAGDHSYYVTAVDAYLESEPSDAITLAAGSQTANLLLNPGAEEECTSHWVNASTTFPPDPANRYSFDNDLFIAVTDSQKAEGQWGFWADQTAGRYDRLAQNTVDETYLLAAYQDVDVSAFSDAIDSAEEEIVADWGGQVFRISEHDSVVPSVAVEFLDANHVVLERHELSSETAGEWVALSSCNRVPAGTRSVRFWMVVPAIRTSPGNAAWDDLSLILREEQPHQPISIGVAVSPSGITVSFGPTIPGKLYQVEYSDSLAYGGTGWRPCGPPLDGDGSSIQWLDSPDVQTEPTQPPAAEVTRRFYRVREQ